MTSPFLSIVTISFNQKRFLRQCVDSVVSQKGGDVEYIVVDPGSTDGSREVLESYGASIDRLVFEPDEGPADGLNKGFALATGRVGYFLNSDDFLLPGAVDRMRSFWSGHPDAEILLGGGWMVDGSGEPLREMVAGPVNLTSLLSGEAGLLQQGMSFSLTRFREVGGFNTDNRTCWDYELLCDMLSSGAQASTTKERFGAFRIYGESISGGVGGEAHRQRYQTDLDRIYRENTGQARPAGEGGVSAIERMRRAVMRPKSSLVRAGDAVFPRGMRQRWESDMNGTGPGHKA